MMPSGGLMSTRNLKVCRRFNCDRTNGRGGKCEYAHVTEGKWYIGYDPILIHNQFPTSRRSSARVPGQGGAAAETVGVRQAQGPGQLRQEGGDDGGDDENDVQLKTHDVHCKTPDFIENNHLVINVETNQVVNECTDTSTMYNGNVGKTDILVKGIDTDRNVRMIGVNDKVTVSTPPSNMNVRMTGVNDTDTVLTPPSKVDVTMNGNYSSKGNDNTLGDRNKNINVKKGDRIKMKKTSLALYHCNARSVANKKGSIDNILRSQELDICFLSEMNTQRPPQFKGYHNFVRVDSRRFHGIMAVVSNAHKGDVIRIPEEDKDLEIVHLVIKSTNPVLHVIGVYIRRCRKQNNGR